MGAPLDGRPSIPDTSARHAPALSRRLAADARASGAAVLEIRALLELDAAERLDRPEERARLRDLLLARGADLCEHGRAIACSRDLEYAARLAGQAGPDLSVRRAAASAAAGDDWKAIGARVEASRAYALAARLGGGTPPRPAPLAPVARKAAPLAPPFGAMATVSEVERWLVTGPALSVRLTALAAARPAALDDVARAIGWVEMALDEDPTSPDLLELGALVLGRARRFGGTERMLMELAYYSPDRPAALARGAAVWERLGRTRQACAEWIRSARWRDDPEDRTWRKAIECARADPGVGDWREIRAYVLLRARPDRRPAVTAMVDGEITQTNESSGADGSAAAADGGATGERRAPADVPEGRNLPAPIDAAVPPSR